jgi:hypothetical protein
LNINMIQDHRSSVDNIAQIMFATVLSANSYREMHATMALRHENEDDDGREITSSSFIREDIRLTSTSPTSPRYDPDLTVETYVRTVYDTRPVRHDFKETGESSLVLSSCLCSSIRGQQRGLLQRQRRGKTCPTFLMCPYCLHLLRHTRLSTSDHPTHRGRYRREGRLSTSLSTPVSTSLQLRLKVSPKGLLPPRFQRAHTRGIAPLCAQTV